MEIAVLVKNLVAGPWDVEIISAHQYVTMDLATHVH